MLLAFLAAAGLTVDDAAAQNAAAPAVSGVSISSSPATGSIYQRGDTITVRADFSPAVAVTGTPQLSMSIGGRTKAVSLASFAGTRSNAITLFFAYTVQSADSDTDGISISANAIGLNGGSITAAGDDTIDAVLSHSAVAASASHRVDGSAFDVPSVSSVSFVGSPVSDDTYRLGERIEVKVKFDRFLRWSGTSQLAITIGRETRLARLFEARAGTDYLAASGTLRFRAGQTAQRITVRVIDDLLPEQDEQFTVTLRNPAHATLAAAAATGTIRDDERAGPGGRFRDCAACPEMVVVPAGSYLMGSPLAEVGRQGDEQQRTVALAEPFAVGAYEVTFAEWDACAADGGCGAQRPDDGGWGRGRRPVINVSWDDARAYVTWLADETGQPYRLLTEAEWEWEYVARGGSWASRRELLRSAYRGWCAPTLRNHLNGFRVARNAP